MSPVIKNNIDGVPKRYAIIATAIDYAEICQHPRPFDAIYPTTKSDYQTCKV